MGIGWKKKPETKWNYLKLIVRGRGGSPPIGGGAHRCWSVYPFFKIFFEPGLPNRVIQILIFTGIYRTPPMKTATYGRGATSATNNQLMSHYDLQICRSVYPFFKYFFNPVRISHILTAP